MGAQYEAFSTEHRRLAILQLLAADDEAATSDRVLQVALKQVQFIVSQDRVKTDLRWLEEQELAVTANLAGLLVGNITSRGRDVAGGMAIVDGVAEPETDGAFGGA